MAVDTTYQGNKGQDNDGIGIYIPKGVEINSYLADKYAAIDKEIKGGLHYIKYYEDLIDDSYAGIQPSKVRVGMLAFCHYKYNSGSPTLWRKLYILNDTPATTLSNWEELDTGSSITLNNVEVIPNINSLPSSANEGDIYNIIDGRQSSDIKEIYSAGGQTFLRLSPTNSTAGYPTAVQDNVEWDGNKWNDLVTGLDMNILVSGTAVSGISSSTTYQIGNYQIYNDTGNYSVVFELLDDSGFSVDSSGWGTFNPANTTLTGKLETSYTITKIANIVTQTPLTIEWLDVSTGFGINASEVALNSGARHSHTNKALLDNITDQGTGTLFLADDGTYKNPNSSALTASNIGTTLEWDGNTFEIPVGENTMVSPVLNVEWSVTENDGSTAYSLVSPYSVNDKNIIVDTGCKVNLNTAQFKYTIGANQYAPEEITGDWGSFNISPLNNIPADDTFTDALNGATLDLPISDITSNEQFDIDFTTYNVKRLKVNPSTWNVYLDTNNEINSESMSVTFGKSIYAGLLENQNGTFIDDLINVERFLIGSTNSAVIQYNNVQTSMINEYVYFLIPDSYGDIISFKEKFPNQSEYTLSVSNTINTYTNEDLIRIANVTDTSPSGVSETYRTYVTRLSNNYSTMVEYLKITV